MSATTTSAAARRLHEAGRGDTAAAGAPSVMAWRHAVQEAAAANTAAWVRAEPFRAHVRGVLADTGLHWRVLAVAAGVPPRVVRALLFGRENRPCRRIRALDAASLLLFTPGTVQRLARTPAGQGSVQTCLRTLERAGHSQADIAAWLHVPMVTLRQLADGEAVGSVLVLAQLVAACMAVGLEGVRAGIAPTPSPGVPAARLPVVARPRAIPAAPPEGVHPVDTLHSDGLRDWAA